MTLPDQQCVPDTLYIWLKAVIYPIWAMYPVNFIVIVSDYFYNKPKLAELCPGTRQSASEKTSI